MEESGPYSNPAAEAEQRDRANYDEERRNVTPNRLYYREMQVFTSTGEPVPSPTLSSTSAYMPDPKKKQSGDCLSLSTLPITLEITREVGTPPIPYPLPDSEVVHPVISSLIRLSWNVV